MVITEAHVDSSYLWQSEGNMHWEPQAKEFQLGIARRRFGLVGHRRRHFGHALLCRTRFSAQLRRFCKMFVHATEPRKPKFS